MRINYLSYDDRLRKQPLTQMPELESVCKKASIVSNESSSVNKDVYNGSNMRNESNVAAINFGGKISQAIYKNKLFNDLLIGFENKTALAQNGVALVVAGGVRPATNIAMANPQDREDCYHAATHSISSGVVGFGVTCSVMKPFTDAVSKFKKDPAAYLKPEMAGVYNIPELGPRKVQGSKVFKATCKMTEMIPEILIGVPKAMLTIALIPPILKYCFGIEKKSKHNNAEVKPEMAIAQNSEVKDEVVELKELKASNSPNFTGAKYDGFVEWLAKNYYGKTMQSSWMVNLGKSMENWNKIDAVEFCSIVNSLIISTLYTVRTLQNKNLNEEKRRTLAVNDVLTFLVSTAVSLTANKSLANYWNKVTHSYASTQLEIEPQKLYELIAQADAETIKVDGKDVKKYSNGIKNAEDFVRDVYREYKEAGKLPKAAKMLEGEEIKNLNFKIKGMGIVKTLFVFGMVYRYIVPVFVMKPANKLGEKWNAHIRNKEEKKLAKMNEELAEKKAQEVTLQALKDKTKVEDAEDLEELEELAEELSEKGMILVPKETSRSAA